MIGNFQVRFLEGGGLATARLHSTVTLCFFLSFFQEEFSVRFGELLRAVGKLIGKN